jgi:hypothetical protein
LLARALTEPERVRERFADPLDPLEIATFGSTDIASTYYQVKVGGDAAALKGIMKAMMVVLGLRRRQIGSARCEWLQTELLVSRNSNQLILQICSLSSKCAIAPRRFVGSQIYGGDREGSPGRQSQRHAAIGPEREPI